jgi:hypothetical protein
MYLADEVQRCSAQVSAQLTEISNGPVVTVLWADFTGDRIQYQTWGLELSE